jgi:RimJ/RimL family protein N-acetyltransferase
MSPHVSWPQIALLRSARLDLEPLRVTHAEEAAALLSDVGLYTFTGGQPPTVAELQISYARQVIGQSPDCSVGFLNWMLRHVTHGVLVGYAQASITRGGAPGSASMTAELAWVIGTEHQGQGYATEAARTVMRWLTTQQVTTFQALIHPHHTASQRVAGNLGLTPTDEVVDGETRWNS